MMLKAGGRLRQNETIHFARGALPALLIEHLGAGDWIVDFAGNDPLEQARATGETPLPPYIKRDTADIRCASDRLRYQTVYAHAEGAIAAPTAGLHFTRELLDRISRAGVQLQRITLHVSPGTFLPIRTERLADHVMHAERYEAAADDLAAIRAATSEGRRVIAVGTTTTRVLETPGVVESEKTTRGRTDIFIHPPCRFRLVDAMLTNFHLPRSTPLMMVSALAGWGNIRRAYEEAIHADYRFYSFGDAMLLLPD